MLTLAIKTLKNVSCIRKLIILFVDGFVLSLAFIFAYLLRYNFNFAIININKVFLQIPFVVLIQIIILYQFRVYSIFWRFIGMFEVKKFIYFAIFFSLILLIFRNIASGVNSILFTPLSVICINGILSFTGLLGVRSLRRFIWEYEEKLKNINNNLNNNKKKTLLIGAGSLGFKILREIQTQGSSSDFDVIGFLDDSRDKQYQQILGVKVLGCLSDLQSIVHKFDISNIIITISKVSGESIIKVVDLSKNFKINLSVIPSYKDILKNKKALEQIREVKIEDLLGRDSINLDVKSIKDFIKNKKVLVTGAGGSIGSEIVRQIITFEAKDIFLVERSEPSMYQIVKEINQNNLPCNLVPIICDINDNNILNQAFVKYRPEIVIHAAANKHVPLMEQNIYAAINNNSIGTYNVANLSGKYGVENFVLISTDKAVRPKSIMGASKRLAEMAVFELNKKYQTNYCAVRFGNVLGSSGSVIPLFREQIKNKGPITVTHKDMTRYFMTIPEACQLVLQAASFKDKDGGQLFVLDMGKPIKILDLAKEMILLSGLIPYKDIDIDITGVRPGEKLSEDLHTDTRLFSKTRHELIFNADMLLEHNHKIFDYLFELNAKALEGNKKDFNRSLKQVIPDLLIQ